MLVYRQRLFTRHACIKIWICLALWKGEPLDAVLTAAAPKLTARCALCHCCDAMERILSGAVYQDEAIDQIDIYHAQTILACDLNTAAQPVANGALVRLRMEWRLSYNATGLIAGKSGENQTAATRPKRSTDRRSSRQ